MTLEQIDTLPKAEKAYWKRAIKVDPKRGLTPALVKRSKTLYGSNALRVKNAKTLLAQILEKFKELIVILLVAAALISLVLGIYTAVRYANDPRHTIEIISLFLEFGVIVGIIFTDIFLSVRQSDKTDKALQTLKSLSVPTAKVIRGGKVKLIPSTNVVPGDIMVLEAGESIAADGRLIESSLLQIDESVLTGESVEVTKDHNFVSNDDMSIGDRKDCVFSGTNVVNGTGLCRVEYTGMKTQIGSIAKLLDEEVADLTPLQKQIAKLSRIVGIVAISVCLVTFILYMVAMTGWKGFNGAGWGESLNVSVTLAIASIPETLLAVVTIILSISVQRLSKQNALIKQLPAVETLGSVSVVCTDKTGTLTKNVMSVTRVWESKYPLQAFNVRRDVDKSLEIFKYGTLCCDAQVLKEGSRVRYIGDSTETAILKGYAKQGGNIVKLNESYQRIGDIPFDADRKMMTVVVPSDNPKFKYMIITKGAPDRIFKHLTSDSANQIRRAHEANKEFGSEALRVLAVAVRYVNELPKTFTPKTLETKLSLIGLLGIIDPPRPEAIASIKELREAGIRTVMITGDHQTTATAIAHELRLIRKDQLTLSGQELKKMSDEELAQNIEKYSVYARVSPSDKLRIVNAWKANGKIVSMTGDGVNDAPSLKAANIGCAMGSGTDVAKDASGMVLMDDNFSTIVSAIDTGRRVMLNIKSALVMLLTANLANLTAILLGILIFFISPIKSLQILFINVAVETTLSFAIASNIRHEPVMRFSPRNPKQFIIDKRMFIEILIFGLLIGLMSLVMFYIGLGSHPAYSFDITKMWSDISLYNSPNAMALPNSAWLISGAHIFQANAYAEFEAFYNYGSLLSFLTLGLCLSLSGLYSRTNGSLFTQKFSDAKKMILMVLISILGIGFVAFVPGVNSVFNMNIYANYRVMTFINYQYYIYLPFGALLMYIVVSEIYRGIYNSFFAKKKLHAIEDESLYIKEKEVKNAKQKIKEVEVIEEVQKTPVKSKQQVQKQVVSQQVVEEQPKQVEQQETKQPSKPPRVLGIKFGKSGEKVKEIVDEARESVKNSEKRKATVTKK